MDIYRHKSLLSNSRRAELFGGKGAVLWFTGLSGSGKSVIASLAEKMLCEQRIRTYMLDGDNLRLSLNSDLGFTAEDRSENIRRLSAVAALLADSGNITLVSAISPFTADREKARKNVETADVPFSEIHINTSLQECIKRDTKGLYKRALSGEIKNFTGIDSPYELPDNPDLVINTEACSPQEAAGEICGYVYMLRRLAGMLPGICEAAVRAGNEIMRIYNTDFTVKSKSDSSPLTEADLASNEIICSFLREKYPTYSLLSEESKDDRSRLSNDSCFIIDPLDGTKEFIKRNGEFTVNIALSYKNKPVLGVVYAPADGRLWYAAKGCGSFCSKGLPEKYFNAADRVFVSERTDKLILTSSRSHNDEITEAIFRENRDKIADIISVGSSLKGCLIASGTADSYYRPGLTNEWDTAAMQCVVEQAGGIFRQLDSTPMRYNRENTLNEKGFYILNKSENLLKMPQLPGGKALF